jgi:hypothetical protein
MVELAVLGGPDAGRTFRPPAGPIRVGRGNGMTVRVSGPGLWDHHFDVVASEDGRFELRVADGAKVSVDDAYVDRCPLRNGTVMSCGGVRIRFGLVPPVQRPLGVRERLVWLALGVAVAAECAVLAWVGY